MISPATAGSHRRRAADAALIGCVQREWNQVDQLADERLGCAKVSAGAELRGERVPNVTGALQRGAASVAEGADVDFRQLR